ncbi:TIGR01841 family phasin [Undibacterium oligocarboniphilum]|uniref:TIGR01841 family phasin n=1 Tax=Undibacterium oligocarboniphilum TaxID=666702 RepID=A0A850QBZ6_9BURK|nr:TIGR01841 family phasin [Undibacterium oligocarboniphilum]MBC3869111.1 TIGR01841 family phasin [Undibacterium oligocarboniphilum]NVO77091.1 TIGR01841 family phasin [Undibacterium oligocarboniphilum]
MPLIQQQISTAAQEQLAQQINVLQALSSTTLTGLEKILALNLSTVKEAVSQATARSLQLWSVKAPQDWLHLSQTHSQPEMERLLAYGRQLAAISEETRENLLQTVRTAQTSVTSHAHATPVHRTEAPVIKAPSTPEAGHPQQLLLPAVNTGAKKASTPATKSPVKANTAQKTSKPATKAKATVATAKTTQPVTAAKAGKPVIPTPAIAAATTPASTPSIPATKAVAAKEPVAKFPFPAPKNLAKSTSANANPNNKPKSSTSGAVKKRASTPDA